LYVNQPNLINRIVIMANDEVGVIADITGALANEGINLESLNTETAGGQGAIILTVDNYDHALYVLNQAGFKAVGDDALVIRLPDEPGALAVVADRLKQAGVNIQSMHILNRQDGQAMIALKTDNRPLAIDTIGSERIV
jgi:hypothetical protein